MQTPSVANLATVRVIWYTARSFHGIPHTMRHGQQPADLLPRFKFLDTWVWLGSPGWYGSMTADQRARAIAFMQPILARNRFATDGWVSIDDVPAAPNGRHVNRLLRFF